MACVFRPCTEFPLTECPFAMASGYRSVRAPRIGCRCGLWAGRCWNRGHIQAQYAGGRREPSRFLTFVCWLSASAKGFARSRSGLPSIAKREPGHQLVELTDQPRCAALPILSVAKLTARRASTARRCGRRRLGCDQVREHPTPPERQRLSQRCWIVPTNWAIPSFHLTLTTTPRTKY